MFLNEAKPRGDLCAFSDLSEVSYCAELGGQWAKGDGNCEFKPLPSKSYVASMNSVAICVTPLFAVSCLPLFFGQLGCFCGILNTLDLFLVRSISQIFQDTLLIIDTCATILLIPYLRFNFHTRSFDTAFH